MQILSLSLLSPSPDESWSIYEGLHPDLRPAVPDDVFTTLLTHQLGAKGTFPRVLQLLELGRDCYMRPSALSQSTQNRLVLALLRRLQLSKWNGPDADILDWLWPTYLEQSRTMANIPLEVRHKWLNYMLHRHREDVPRVHAAVKKMVEEAGGEGLGQACARVLTMCRNHDPDVQRSALRLATWCIARDVKIHDSAIRTLFARLKADLERIGEDGVAGVRLTTEALIAELINSEAYDQAQRLRLVLDTFVSNARPTRQKASELARDPMATMPKVHRTAQKILSKSNVEEADLDAVVDLCLRALKFQEADHEALFRIATRRLTKGEADPRHIIRLGNAVLDAGIPGTDAMTPQLVTRMLYAVINVIPQNDEAYGVAQRLYPFARSPDLESPQRWPDVFHYRWFTFFNTALKHGHIDFASRLYADFQADAQVVPRSTQLAFIRKIAQTPSHSRPVLLDRHIKDYLWDPEAPTEALVVQLCLGLSKTPDDAAYAIYLSRRVEPYTPLPLSVIKPLAVALASSDKYQRRVDAVKLLRELPVSEKIIGAYNAVLNALSKGAREHGFEHLVLVHQDMTARNIVSDANTASILIKACLAQKQLDMAVKIFDAAIDGGYIITPTAVSGIMTRLALSGLVDEAYKVHSRWTALVSSTETELVGKDVVFGALLLVDIKAGRELDLPAVVCSRGDGQQYHNWEPSRKYLQFLKQAQREQRGEGSPAVAASEQSIENEESLKVESQADVSSR